MQEEGALQQKISELSCPNKLLGESSLVPDGLSSKGKKRERQDHNADEVVGLSDAEAVEELLARMKLKQTSSQRSTIAATIKATTREDCLYTFVHLGGVSLLDDWIQDGAKAMGSNSAEHKGVDPEMMMIMMILQALEKLPIDLETLKGCSIGKSVNHLRTMKNVEVQKKARKMVDVWKKRVENEMKYSIALSSSKSGEIAGEAMVAASKFTIMEKARVAVVGEALAMATSTSDVSPKTNDKSEEKDESKDFSSSITSTSLLTTVKRQKHSAAMALETLNAKDETGNVRQKHSIDTTMETSNAVKGKDVKDETCNVRQKHSAAMVMEISNAVKRKDEPSNGKIELDGNGNGHDSTPATTHVKERANEYRKKLRSCSPAIAQWSTIDLPTNASPSQEVTTKHEKIALQNNRSIDGNAGDSEQQHEKLSRSHMATKVDSAEVVNATSESPGQSSTRSGGREEATTKTHVEEENHVRVSCLSSQSNLQIPQVQGDTEVLVESKVVASSDGKQASLKIGDCSPKLSSSEPELAPVNASPAMTALKQEAEVQEARQGVEAGEGHPECEYSNDALSRARTDERVLFDKANNSGSRWASVLVNVDSREEKEEPNVAACTSSSSKGTSDQGNLVPNGETQMRTSEVGVCGGMEMGLSGARPREGFDFDLNERFASDEFLQDSEASCSIPPLMSPAKTESASSKATCTLTAPIAVCAASRGTFILPPVNSVMKCGIGWKGSAATSAFRPAEPRNVTTSKRERTSDKLASCLGPARNIKNFDLNVADDQGSDCPVKVVGCLADKQAKLDLNGDGDGDLPKTMGIQRLVCSSKPALLDFDLNEQLDDEAQKQEEQFLLPSHTITHSPCAFGGAVAMPVMSASNVISWHPSGAPSFTASSMSLPRPPDQQFLLAPTSLPSNSRQPTIPILPPTLPSVVYSQIPIFGCPPFQATFSYTPGSMMPPNSPFLMSKPTAVSSEGLLTRVESPLARPPYPMSMDDLRGGGSNGFYSWGGPNSSIRPAVINYKDGKDQQFLNGSVNAPPLEDQMRAFQQSSAPTTSLMRQSDSNYFLGVKHSAWP